MTTVGMATALDMRPTMNIVHTSLGGGPVTLSSQKATPQRTSSLLLNGGSSHTDETLLTAPPVSSMTAAIPELSLHGPERPFP